METLASTSLCSTVTLMAAPTVPTVCRVCVQEMKVCMSCDNVRMVEIVGVDSSVLSHGSGYTEDSVDHWRWHCTTCY